MIEITYNMREIILEGHAGYGAAGTDIICAAVSGIWYTLLAKLEREMEKGNIQYEATEEVGKARAKLIGIAEEYDACAGEVWDTVICGLRALSIQYPEFVKIRK